MLPPSSFRLLDLHPDPEARSTTSRPSSPAGRSGGAARVRAPPGRRRVSLTRIVSACKQPSAAASASRSSSRSSSSPRRAPTRSGCGSAPARSVTATSPTPRARGAADLPAVYGHEAAGIVRGGRVGGGRIGAGRPRGRHPRALLRLVPHLPRGQPALCEATFALDGRVRCATRAASRSPRVCARRRSPRRCSSTTPRR